MSSRCRLDPGRARFAALPGFLVRLTQTCGWPSALCATRPHTRPGDLMQINAAFRFGGVLASKTCGSGYHAELQCWKASWPLPVRRTVSRYEHDLKLLRFY